MPKEYDNACCTHCGKPAEHKYCSPKCRYAARKARGFPYQRSETVREKRERENKIYRELQQVINRWRVPNGHNGIDNTTGAAGVHCVGSEWGGAFGGQMAEGNQAAQGTRRVRFLPRPPLTQSTSGGEES